MKKRISSLLCAIVLLCCCVACTTTEEIYSEYETVDTTAKTTVEKVTGDTTETEKTDAEKTTTGATKQTRVTKATTTVRTTVRGTLPPDIDEVVSKDGFDFTVMTFNVRYKDDANGHSIAERAPRVEATVNAHSPDIIGMQEVIPEWDDQLTRRFSDEYGLFTHYRADKNPEGHTILYKKSTFEYVDEGFFWLSDTPNKESKGWGANLPRIASWVLLKHRATGRKVLFFTYHGHGTDEFAKNSCDMILAKMAEYPDTVKVITGDFNRNDSTEGYAYFTKTLADARKTATGTGWSDQDGTCPAGYPNRGPATGHGKVIDHILYDPNGVMSLSAKIDTTQYDGYFASDHYAVVATLRVKAVT